MAAQNQFHITLDIPQFRGNPSDNIADWFTRIEDTIRPLAEDDDDFNTRMISLMPQKLTHNAYKVFRDLPRGTKTNYEECKTRLCDIFNNQDFLRTFQGSLTARPRKDDEHIDVYVAEIRNLVSQAFPDYNAPQQEAETYRRFVKGVSNFLRAKIYEHDPKNLNEAIRICKNAERARSELDPQLEHSILPQPIVAQIDTHKPQDQTDIILSELLDEFKKMSTTISSELKRQGDAIQHLSDRQNNDHSGYNQNRSRDFSRRRDFYNTNPRQNDHSLSRDRNQPRQYTREFSNRSWSRDRQQNDHRYNSRERGQYYRSPSFNRYQRQPYESRYRYDSQNNMTSYNQHRRERSNSGDRRNSGILRRPQSNTFPQRSPSNSRANSMSPRRVAFQRQENE